VQRPVLERLSQSVIYALFHHLRLFGWIPLLPLGAYHAPAKTLALLAAYASVHRRKWWQRGVHQFFSHGASRRTIVVNPYKDQYSTEQRYLGCIHPHGIPVDAVHNCTARQIGQFDGDPGKTHPTEVNSFALCFAPVISHVPVHQEMYRDLCGDATPKAIRGWWDKRMPDGTRIDPIIAPGGFSECCFADAADTENEYLYLKGRQGFLKIAIENGADIAPCFSFNGSNMYYNIPFLKGARARLSQKIFIGLSWPFGKWGTMMPLTDQCATVWFPPFRSSEYTIDQLDECHTAYLEHVKKYFDIHKAEYMQNAECQLEFIGKDFVDKDPLARLLGLDAEPQLQSKL